MRLVSWRKSIDLVSDGGEIGLKVIESGRANCCYTGIVYYKRDGGGLREVVQVFTAQSSSVELSLICRTSQSTADTRSRH